MTDINCTYTGDRDEILVAYLYDEIDPAERAVFDAHVRTCARCRTELAALGGVRERLARWNPPEPAFNFNGRQAVDSRADVRWWRQIPAWAQVAAALLFLGVSAGIANLDVRYDGNGLSVRTGWMAPKAVPAPTTASVRPSPDAAPWRADLTALESQLRSELRSQQPASAAQVRSVSDADVKRLVSPLLTESEKRQQRELALRVAELLRDVAAQRQADLVSINQNLGLIRTNTMTVDQRQRDLQNYVLRVSQQR